MPSLRLTLICAALIGPAIARSAENKSPPWQSREWPRIEATLGSMNLDGTLRLSYPLTGDQTLKFPGWRCALTHRITQDAHGRARSAWQFEGLASWLAPEGRDQLSWQPPDGPAIRFDRAKIGHALAEAGSHGWEIRETAAGSYEIRARDGRTWHYHDGVLTRLTHPALGEFRVVTQGGLIREIVQTDALNTAAPLLRAGYDDSGHPIRLSFGESPPQSFAWDGTGELVAWKRVDGSTVRFGYASGLLQTVSEPGKPTLRLTWAENPGYERGDSKWPAPVHVSSDGLRDYTYRLTSAGFVIRARDRVTGKTVTTVFNPLRLRLEQHRADGKTRVVTFRRNAATGGLALARIANGRGKILEDFRYDGQGLLVAIKRPGTPEQTLSYDESGRLMGLTEGGGR